MRYIYIYIYIYIYVYIYIYIYIEGETEEGREISGEHDNISENLRILLIICILHGIQMSLMIALLFEVEDALLIY